MGGRTASIGGQPATAEELARHRRGQRRGRARLGAAVLALLGFAALLARVVPGYTRRLIVVGLLVAGWLLWRRLPLEAGFALVALLAAWLYSPLKRLAERPRPAAIEGDIRVYSQLEGAGFPSGHVVAY